MADEGLVQQQIKVLAQAVADLHERVLDLERTKEDEALAAELATSLQQMKDGDTKPAY